MIKVLRWCGTVFFAVLAAALMIAILPESGSSVSADDGKLVAELCSEERVDIVVGSESDYTIVFSTDSKTPGNEIAAKVRSTASSLLGARLTMKADNMAKETEHEIIVGYVDRDIITELHAIFDSYDSSDILVWGCMYKDGKLAYSANSPEALDYGKYALLSLITEDGFSVDSDYLSIGSITRAEYEQYLKDKAEAEEAERREKKFAELNAMQNAFTQDQFGEYKSIIGEDGYYEKSPYASPWFYPVSGEHPRLIVNKGDLKTVKALLEDPEYADLAENFWNMANASCEYGIFPPKLGASGEYYRFNANYLGIMTTKAFAYLLTGDELYALEAIVSIKNAMLTYKYTADIHSDTYHGGSEVLFAASLIYDWCYDYITEEDTYHFLAGIVNLCISTMEIDYPPSNMGYVSGHGTGPQFLRDMMVMATAFSDEAPDWWEFIAGRYFQYYLPVGNLAYGSGWISQGTANYAYNKMNVMLWAAVCVYGATGEIVLNEGANDSMYFLLSHTMPETGNYFQTGDGGRTANGASRSWEYTAFFLAAALYRDPIVFANAKYLTENFSQYNTNSVSVLTPAMQLGFISVYMRDGDDTGDWRYQDIPLIQYCEPPAAQMTARNSWTDPDAAAVFMRIGTKTMANHDCFDHGTFQIYYKGLLACASGSYHDYGGYIHKYYLQATISHNGLLVFNPAYADEEPEYGTLPDGSVDKMTVLNHKRYFYSGSQESLREAGSFEAWVGGDYDMAEMLGVSSGYNSDGSADYGYIAGDITKAYAIDTVEFISRRMLTVYTGDTEFPMLFFTYDNITAMDESFAKTYLLHTVKEPEVDTENFVATVTQDRGKMYVHSLFGADEIRKIGGEGYAYWINGKNCYDSGKQNDSANTIWGRIEFTAAGEKNTNFLTAMYVTDAENTNTLPTEKFESDTVQAAVIKNKVAVFVKSDAAAFKEFSFTTEGVGLYDYYISGVENGTWNVIVDGISTAYAYASEGEGFITFTAPSGNVRLVPGKDVIGANGGKIQYNAMGGVVPDDVPLIYNNEEDTPLPTNVTKENCTFIGWYTSPTYDPETLVTFIPAGTQGTFKVYARWLNVYVNEDYSENSVDILEGNVSVGGISYSGSSKPGAEFKTEVAEDGSRYVVWIKGTKDPALSVPAGASNVSNTGVDDKCISYTLKLSRHGDAPVIPATIRMIASHDVAGAELSPTTKINLFRFDASGSVTLENQVIHTLRADKITELRFVLDFKNCEIRVYADDYTVLASAPIPLPVETGAQSGEELMKCFRKHMIHFYASSGGSGDQAIRIFGIRIEDGDVFSPLTPNYENPIKYVTDGADLPADAPREYSKEVPTVLPTNITRENAVFVGWYTSETFAEDTLIKEVPVETEGEITLYAKWKWLLLDEDYSETEIDFTEVNGEKNGMTYSSNSNAGVSYKTKTDESGKRYLEWQKGVGDPALAIVGTGRNLTNISSGQVSLTVKIAKDGASAVPNMNVNFIANRDASGTKLSSSAKILAFNITGGKILLAGKSEVATVTEEITILRFVVDFDELEMRAYDEAGEVIATESFAIPEKTGAANGRELMTCFNQRILHFHAQKSTEERSVRFYGFRAVEGDEFTPVYENPIDYQLAGGDLPSGAPKEYSKDEPTVLPIPTKEKATFLGWYTSADFSPESLITEIPTDSDGAITVYAKWRGILLEEDYSETKVSIEAAKDTINLVGYVGNSKLGSSYITKTDENGRPYLEWVKGENDPSISLYPGENNFTNSTADEISFTFELSAEAGKTVPTTTLRLIANHDVNGTKLSSSEKTTLAYITTAGAVSLGGTEPIATIEEGVITTLRIVVDFADLELRAYDGNGEVLARTKLAIPEKTLAENGKELMKCYTGYLAQFWMSSKGDATNTLLIYSMKVEEGDAFAK
ncbi:MAG: InlB B-repeat-containing protein [Clostridia bacterium]|nr:InlB B-repeat-containing protein [Clostridia bacterium]